MLKGSFTRANKVIFGEEAFLGIEARFNKLSAAETSAIVGTEGTSYHNRVFTACVLMSHTITLVSSEPVIR